MAINSPYRSSSDLVIEALKNLGQIAPGQAIDVEDFNYVNEKLDPTLRLIAGLEIISVADPNNIPGAWFSPLADILAGECATKFGFTGQDLAGLVNKGIGGMAGVEIGAGVAAKALKIMSRGRPTYEIARTLYY